MPSNKICPVCGHTSFAIHKGKRNVKCKTCGSNERIRATWLLLSAFGDLTEGAKVAHFAPEGSLGKKLREVCGAGYEAFELQDGKSTGTAGAESGARQVDPVTGLGSLKSSGYDVVIHNHLLPKIGCNYTILLQRLHQLLKPGGLHIFSIPVYDGHDREDLDPSVPTETRRKRFGHPTHYRRFGIEDFDRTIGMIFNISAEAYRLDSLIDRSILSRSAVPEKRWTVRGGAVLIVRRRDVRAVP